MKTLGSGDLGQGFAESCRFNVKAQRLQMRVANGDVAVFGLIGFRLNPKPYFRVRALLLLALAIG